MALIQRKPGHIDGQSPEYIPIRILEIELESPLPALSAFDANKGCYYQRARCLIRLHTKPLGIVDLIFDKVEIDPNEYAPVVWEAMKTQINEHLRKDGLPTIKTLPSNGLLAPSTPLCIEEREKFLNNAPFVSVIVSTRDRSEQLTTCLSSLMSLHYPHYEVIIVDNAPSTMATADFIQQNYGADPKIKYVRENRPGLSMARNCGIQVACGEIIAFTDDDVVVDTFWLAELVKAFSSEKNVACVTGLGLPLELDTQAQAWFEESGGFNKGFVRRTFDRTKSPTDVPLHPFTAGRFGSGASMAFTSAVLHKIGGFDLALGTGTRTGGGEDLASFFQVITKGYRLVYEPASLLYHLHRRDYPQFRKQLYYCGVGLAAYLTKVVLDNPLFLFNFIAKVPYGLFFILSPRSPKNSKKSNGYPKELYSIERKGMLYGPFAYLHCRWEIRKPSKKQSMDNGTIVTTLRERQIDLRR